MIAKPDLNKREEVCLICNMGLINRMLLLCTSLEK